MYALWEVPLQPSWRATTGEEGQGGAPCQGRFLVGGTLTGAVHGHGPREVSDRHSAGAEQPRVGAEWTECLRGDAVSDLPVIKVGDWIRFMYGGRVVIAPVLYLVPKVKFDSTREALTEFGQVSFDAVLEVRKAGHDGSARGDETATESDARRRSDGAGSGVVASPDASATAR